MRQHVKFKNFRYPGEPETYSIRKFNIIWNFLILVFLGASNRLINNFHVFWCFEDSRCFRIHLHTKSDSFLKFTFFYIFAIFLGGKVPTGSMSNTGPLKPSSCQNKDAYVLKVQTKNQLIWIYKNWRKLLNCHPKLSICRGPVCARYAQVK